MRIVKKRQVETSENVWVVEMDGKDIHSDYSRESTEQWLCGQYATLREQIKAIRERVKELKTDNDERAERWERRGEEKMGQFSLCRSSECEIILAAIDEITGVSE